MSTLPHILVVEDEPAIQALLRVNLAHGQFSATLVGSAEEAEVVIRERLPDLVLLDWMLPGQSGVAFARRLRGDPRTRNLPIIMLTAKAAETEKVEGLEVGADDYVTKPFSPKELLARIRAVLRRRQPELSELALTVGRLTLNPDSHELHVAGERLALGPLEFRLLKFLMTHPGRVYSRGQLLDEVWGDHVFIDERTVDVQVRRLRAALAIQGEGGRIETVRGVGYRFSAASPDADA